VINDILKGCCVAREGDIPSNDRAHHIAVAIDGDIAVGRIHYGAERTAAGDDQTASSMLGRLRL